MANVLNVRLHFWTRNSSDFKDHSKVIHFLKIDIDLENEAVDRNFQTALSSPNELDLDRLFTINLVSMKINTEILIIQYKWKGN